MGRSYGARQAARPSSGFSEGGIGTAAIKTLIERNTLGNETFGASPNCTPRVYTSFSQLEPRNEPRACCASTVPTTRWRHWRRAWPRLESSAIGSSPVESVRYLLSFRSDNHFVCCLGRCRTGRTPSDMFAAEQKVTPSIQSSPYSTLFASAS